MSSDFYFLSKGFFVSNIEFLTKRLKKENLYANIYFILSANIDYLLSNSFVTPQTLLGLGFYPKASYHFLLVI